jgi:hypothetical protein
VPPPIPPAKRTLGVAGIPPPARMPVESAPQTVPPEPQDREFFAHALQSAEQRINDRIEGHDARLREDFKAERQALELELVRLRTELEQYAKRPTASSVWAKRGTVGAICTAIVGIVTALASVLKPAPPEESASKVYTALKAEQERQAQVSQRQYESTLEFREWTLSYLRSTGVTIPEQPGMPSRPPSPPVQIKITPTPSSSVAPIVVSRRGIPRAAGVTVTKAPPPPAPQTRAPTLPNSADQL